MAVSLEILLENIMVTLKAKIMERTMKEENSKCFLVQGILEYTDKHEPLMSYLIPS